MLILGIILLILGLVLSSNLLWVVGLVLAAVGAVMWIAAAGDRSWGRRWY